MTLNKHLLETSEVYREIAALDCFSDEIAQMECYTEEEYEGMVEVPPLFEFSFMTAEEKQSYVDDLNSRFPGCHWVVQNGLPVEVKAVKHIDDGTLPEIEF